MQFGVCTSLENGALAKAQGWDFVEENVQSLLQGTLVDAEWKGMDRVRACPLPCVAANCLVPGNLKITGPAVDMPVLTRYITNVMTRAKKSGMKVLVFGSAGARNIPEGFDRETARQQILAFLRMAVPLAAQNGITLVAEPLNKKESNVMNTVAESMTYVRAINQPAFQCLVDAYHFLLDGDSLDALKVAMPFIKHVHLADKDGRVAPGLSGTTDYRPIFQVLKQFNYTGVLSVEAIPFDLKTEGPGALEFLKKQWAEA